MTPTPPPRRKKRRLLRRWLSARGRRLEITRSGWLFIALTLAVGLAAINSGANLLHALFGAMMALIIGSGVLSESTLHRVRVRRVLRGPLYAGEPGAAEVQLHNVDRRRDVLAVSVEDDDELEEPGHGDPVFAVRVAAGQTIALSTRVTMPARGHHHLPRIVVATRFPFGLFVKRRELPVDDEVRVYPRRVPAPPDPPRSADGGPATATGRRARAGEFHGLRPYRDGDELRRLHWPATARLGQPVVREHEAGQEPRVRLHLAPGSTGNAGFEAEVERVAARATLLLLRDHAELELYYGERPAVPPGAGPAQHRRLMDFLAGVG
ncbi:MAG: DUF58 domain-containing protein [Deltaproteobacteria bacterium]|nr:DUF58 domain-containing protein [Deltaproteobacteria bacterium]